MCSERERRSFFFGKHVLAATRTTKIRYYPVFVDYFDWRKNIIATIFSSIRMQIYLFFFCIDVIFQNGKKRENNLFLGWIQCEQFLWYDLVFIRFVLWLHLSCCGLLCMFGEAFYYRNLGFLLVLIRFHLSFFMTVCTCARMCVCHTVEYRFVFFSFLFCVWRQIPVCIPSMQLLPFQY